MDFPENNISQKPNDIKIKYWEQTYPGCSDRFEEVFGTLYPEPKQIAQWQQSWIDTTPYRLEIITNSISSIRPPGVKEEMKQCCNDLGIHFFFWDYRFFPKSNTYPLYSPDSDDNKYVEHFYKVPMACFYYIDDFILFKLVWDKQ